MMDSVHGQAGAFGQDAMGAAAVVMQQVPGQAPKAERYEGILDAGQRGGSDDADTWFLTMAICIPVSAAVGVVIAYSVGHDPFRAFGIGAVVGLVALGLLLALYRVGNFGAAQHASVDTYNELCRRMDHALRVTPVLSPDDPARAAQDRAFQGVAASGEAFRAARDKRGMHWVLSRGYIDLQGVVHRAEQDLMLYEPLEQLLDDALIDQARLNGSQLPQRDDLLRRSSRALAALCPESTMYLPPLAPVAMTASPAAKDDVQPQAAVDHLNPGVAARVILQDVRYQVNAFRNDRRRRLIQVRDNLISTLFLTGLVTLLLLALLVMGRPDQATLLGGAILYAIGMIVGLFVHLSAVPDPGKRQEDYGLATVALFQIAALSGIAAVLGAYVGVTFPAAMDVTKLNAHGLGSIPSPAQVYDLSTYSAAIIFAVVFAVTPRLLVQRLAAGVTQTQNELKSSSPGN